MKYVIGIDGGGTKTKATSYHLDTGEELFSVQKGRSNFAAHYRESLDQVIQAIQDCVRQSGGVLPEKILLGSAGAYTRKICVAVKEDLRKQWPIDITVIDDAQLAHTALLEGKDGLLVIAGTGSIVLGRHAGVEWKTGGWGYLLGDEGSGYWISIKAIQYALHRLELGKENDQLTKALLNHVEGHSISDIKTFVYTSSKEEIASLSKLVDVEASNSCKASLSILRKAGEELAVLVNRALKGHKELLPQLKVAVSGSILLKNDVVYEAFQDGLLNLKPGCEIVRSDGDVCRAVLYV